MRVLLDTHAFVWATLDDERLPGSARDVLKTAEMVFVSAVSAYEIEYKRHLDDALSRMPHDLDEAVMGQDFNWLGISAVQATRAAKLPKLHRDPWDRILVAQSLETEFALVSRDSVLARYGVTLIW